MKTIKCRSCGASVNSNMQYCEYCDNPIAEENGYSGESKSSRNFQQDSFVFEGLEYELSKNLSSQSKTNFYVTEVHLGEEMVMQIMAASAVSDYLKTNNPSFPGLAIHMPIPRDQQHMYKKFIALEESSSFVHTDDPESPIHDFMIDMGNDIKKVSKLVTKILIEVYGISKDSHFVYNTLDYND